MGQTLKLRSCFCCLSVAASLDLDDKPLHVQDFGDVMKAISSNSARWGITEVTLQLKRAA